MYVLIRICVCIMSSWKRCCIWVSQQEQELFDHRFSKLSFCCVIIYTDDVFLMRYIYVSSSSSYLQRVVQKGFCCLCFFLFCWWWAVVVGAYNIWWWLLLAYDACSFPFMLLSIGRYVVLHVLGFVNL